MSAQTQSLSLYDVSPVSGYCSNCDRYVRALVPSRDNPAHNNPVLVACYICEHHVQATPAGGDTDE